MTACNLSRVSISVIVIVIFFLAACTVRNEETAPLQAIDATQPAETRPSSTPETASTPDVTGMLIPADVVEVTVDRTVYQVGKRVRFTISNHSDSSVYYREGGCTWPFIVRLEGENEVQLAINITEEEIPTRQLAAGETLSCKWRQQAWSVADMGFHHVPPGQYQIKFPYSLEQEDVTSGDTREVAESQVFAIE